MTKNLVDRPSADQGRSDLTGREKMELNSRKKSGLTEQCIQTGDERNRSEKNRRVKRFSHLLDMNEREKLLKKERKQ